MVAERSGSHNRSSVCPRFPFPFETMESVPSAAGAQNAGITQQLPAVPVSPESTTPGGAKASARTHFDMSPEHPGGGDQQARRRRVSRSSTPTLRAEGSSTPKRLPGKAFTDSPPPPVDPGSPWSNVAGDVPGAGASADDVRFWAYQKFGHHHTRLTTLAAASNYMLDSAKLIRHELDARPTFDEVSNYVQQMLTDKLQGYVAKDAANSMVNEDKVKEMFKTFQDRLEANYPTIIQTEKFVKEQFNNAEASTAVLTAHVKAAMVQIEHAITSTEKNLKMIEEVENNFHIHVAESFSKVEAAVEDLRAPRGPARHDDKTCHMMPPGIPPELSTAGTSGDCCIQSIHCHHVEKLIQDVQGLKDYSGLISGHGLLHGRVAQVEQRITKLEGKAWLMGWRGPNGEPVNDPQGGHPGAPHGGHPGAPHGGQPGAHRGGNPGGAPGGGPGGFGQGPGSSGGGAPGDWSPTWPQHTRNDESRIDYSKIFDDKVALSTEYAYNGGDGGDRWRQKTYGYLISKCPTLSKILKWAEGCDNRSISQDAWMAENNQEKWMTELNLVKLSEALWGFLNTCLKDEAHTTFENAEELNGYDGWRLVVQEIQKGRSVRKATLRKLVKNPPKINKLEDVNAGMIKYRNILREYAAVEGKIPDESEQKCDLLESLPLEIRENLMWRAHNMKGETYTEFQNHVQATVNEILFHRGRLPSPINAVEGPTRDDVQQNESMKAIEKINDLENMIGAMMKRMGYRPNANGGGGSGAQPRSPGPRRPNEDRPPKCANCGASGHTKDDCNKQKVPLSQRLCHECGKPGHIAANCRQRKNRSAGLVDDSEADDVLGCVQWRTVGNLKSAGRPTPKPMTLESYIPTTTRNKFGALETVDDEPAPEAECRCCSGRESVSPRKARRDAARQHRIALRTESWKKADQQMEALQGVNIKNEPNIETSNEPNDAISTLGSLVYRDEDEDAIMAADEEIEVDVAQDSGCVANVAGPDDIPSSVEVAHPPGKRVRGFVAANGSDMENYGEANVRMVAEDGSSFLNSFTVTDVTRPLHATSQTCDSTSERCPDGHEVLFTKGEATVVPAGALSRFLGNIRHIATYPRRGGLYVAKMKVRAPGARGQKRPSPKKPGAQGFRRLGAKQ